MTLFNHKSGASSAAEEMDNWKVTPRDDVFLMIFNVAPTLRAAFKFGRRVHFALRREMLKPPIARLPAI